MQTLLKKTIVWLLVILMPTISAAQSGSSTTAAQATPSITKWDTSFNLGPVAVSLQMSRPEQTPAGAVWDTLHLEVRDDTQTPPLHATVDAVGQAPDVATLFGGFLPATIIIQQDLVAGQTLAQAIADAQTKTGVTVTCFQDVTALEYGLIAALIAVVIIAAVPNTSPALSPELSAISTKLQANLAIIQGTPGAPGATTIQ